MIEENYPESKIEELRQSLEKDGWMKHENLPENWLYKKYKKGLNTCKMSVITSKGILIKSKDIAKSQINNLEEIRKLEDFYQSSFILSKSVENKMVDPDNTLQDCEEPFLKGWKFKMAGDKIGKSWKMFISPNGEKINGKRMLLKFMLEQNYSEQSIELLRNSFQKDGWNQDERLPKNWLFKKSKRAYFISSSGNYYNSKEKALRFLKLSSLTQNEYELLLKFPTI